MVLPTDMPTKTIYDGLGISPHFVYTFNESHAFSGKKECLVHKFLMDLWVDFAYKVRKHKTQKLLTLTNVNYLGMLPIYVYYLLLVHISNSMQIFPDLHTEYLRLIFQISSLMKLIFCLHTGIPWLTRFQSTRSSI